jgi:nicotinate-nucleotide adenylyltransferase
LPRQRKTIDPSRGGLWGIMGGTFDPLHYGHLVMAESVLHSVGADGMLFVPARVHPFKSDRQLADYGHRIEMVRMAIADNERFRLEEPPEGMKFTIDLIDYVRHRYPSTDFFLAVGSDIVDEFVNWRKHDEIEHNIRIVIAARPGSQTRPRDSGVLRGAEWVMIPQYDLSSTAIRERVRSKLPIRYMTPDPVLRHIYQHKLYV